MGLGLVLHKPAAAISLGAAFARSGYSFWWIFGFVSLFASMTPIGCIVGMLAAKTSLLVDTIFVCLSAGTFIYVACSEIIVTEFEKGQLRWAKIGLVALGCILIGSLWFIGGAHDHGHGEEGHAGHDDHDHRLL